MTINTVKFSQFVLPNLSNTTNTLVGVSSPAGGINYQAGFPLTWVSATRPTTPANGTLGYNVSLSQYEYWNGAAWVQLSAGGSGTVNPGAQNQVAWYATTGTAISGLLNFANSVLVTNAGTVPSLSTTLPASLTIPIPNVIGITDGSNAAAGSVGETITTTFGSLSVASTTITDFTTITLTPGQWMVWGSVAYTTTVSGSGASAWINTTSVTPASIQFQGLYNSISFGQLGFSIVPQIFNVTVNQTIYLTGEIIFGSGSAQVFGSLFALRFR
jgi:hypothetical protein